MALPEPSAPAEHRLEFADTRSGFPPREYSWKRWRGAAAGAAEKPGERLCPSGNRCHLYAAAEPPRCLSRGARALSAKTCLARRCCLNR